MKLKPEDIGFPSSLVERSSRAPSRLILNVEALEKQGKTRFALSAPDPTILLDWDGSAEEGPLRWARSIGKRVIHVRLAIPPIPMDALKADPFRVSQEQTDYAAKSIRPLWRRFRDAYFAALKSRARTLIVDTGTAMWSNLLLARYGKSKQIPQFMYDILNAEMFYFFNAARESDKNVIFTHRLKDQYLEQLVRNRKTGETERQSMKTGQYDRRGWSHVGFEVQANVRLSRDPKTLRFQATVLDSRHSGEVAGTVLDGGDCCFAALSELLLGDRLE